MVPRSRPPLESILANRASTNGGSKVLEYISGSTRAPPDRAGHYGMNIARLTEGRPYRRSNPDGFRPIHHQLALAVGGKRPITLTFLENQPDKISRNARERHFIRMRQIAVSDGGLPVLNSV